MEIEHIKRPRNCDDDFSLESQIPLGRPWYFVCTSPYDNLPSAHVQQFAHTSLHSNRY